MKHIFLVNSNTTMLVALKTIEHLALLPQDCGFLCTRKYRIPADMNIAQERIRQFDFMDRFQYATIKQTFRQAWRFSYNRQVMQSADQMIDELTDGKEFELYIYHGRNHEADTAITHRNCRSFSYLEEGTLAYTTNNDCNYQLSPLKMKLFQQLLKAVMQGRAFQFSWAVPYDFSHAKYRTVYCCHEDAFPARSDKTIVGMPFAQTGDYPDDLQSVIVFDGGIISREDQKKSLRINFEHASSQGIKILYFKFHPGFNDALKQEYWNYFNILSREFAMPVKELPPTACLENIAYTLKDKLNMYIVCSSAGFYASLCGANIFCTAQHFIADNPSLQRFYRILPEKLFQRYTNI